MLEITECFVRARARARCRRHNQMCVANHKRKKKDSRNSSLSGTKRGRVHHARSKRTNRASIRIIPFSPFGIKCSHFIRKLRYSICDIIIYLKLYVFLLFYIFLKLTMVWRCCCLTVPWQLVFRIHFECRNSVTSDNTKSELLDWFRSNDKKTERIYVWFFDSRLMLSFAMLAEPMSSGACIWVWLWYGCTQRGLH